MEHKTIIHIANYAAPYKGNFIASLEILEEKLRQNNNRMIYIFPESCRNTPWIEKFAECRVGGGNLRTVSNTGS